MLSACGLRGGSEPTAPTNAAEAAAPVDTEQVPLVVEAFEEYQAAAIASEGEVAAARLADTVDAFYDSARKQALTAQAEELSAQPVHVRLTVLLMRGSVPAPVLRSGSPSDLVVAAIDAGLVGEAGLSQLKLDQVTVTGDSARASVLVQGQPAPFQLAFLRQEGRWTLDLVPLINLGQAALEQGAKQQGISIDELIDRTLEQKYGSDKAARLQEPLGA